MSVDLLEQPLETIEDHVAASLIAGELRVHEAFEHRRVAVRFLPELRDLREPALEAWAFPGCDGRR